MLTNVEGKKDYSYHHCHGTALGSDCVAATRSGKQTQKDKADSGAQFITPAGPRQSLLLAKDPDQHL